MSQQDFAGAAPLLTSTALLVRLRLRRLWNLMLSGQLGKKAGNKPGNKTNAKVRSGNPGKKSSAVLVFTVWPLMLFAFGSIIRNAVVTLHDRLDPGGFWLTVEFSAAFTVGLAFMLLTLWFASLLMTVASGELVKAEWDLEWLVTLPVRAETLLWARILERSIVNPSGFIMLLPACIVIAWYSGYRWSAPLVGLLAAWPLLLLAALGRTLLDTGLRLRMSASRLRNLHAVISVLSIVTMYLAMSMGLAGKGRFMLGIAAGMPEWLAWTPPGLVVRVLNERTFIEAAWLVFELLAEVAIILWLGVQILQNQLRHGVISGGARDTARAPPSPVEVASDSKTPGASRLKLTAVQWRELTLLSRDRNFLVQCLVVPLLIVGGQLLLGSSGIATSMWRDPNVLASVGFGLAAYSLSMSAFQTLNSEGQALWLLYTFPCSFEEVLKDKARLWGAMTLLYPLILFAVGMFVMPDVGWKFCAAVITTFLGIPIYAFIAVALGVFGSNPLEQHQSQKVKPEYVYLYMGLAGLYIYAVVTPNFYQRIVFMVLTLLLSFALWQKARDRLPYLLDPDVAPPAKVSISDGLIAAMVFFVIQGIIMAIGGGVTISGAALLFAFAIAGALTYTLMRYVYARTRTEGVPRLRGDDNRPIIPVVAGLAAGACAIVYLLALRGSPWLDQAKQASNTWVELGYWVVPLALIAAPIFEEFIFRGLIYGGLRRSFGQWPAALTSAALFACLHPPISIAPVFVLGVATAFAYERSRGLLAPMLTHATYNACVIGAQMLMS